MHGHDEECQELFLQNQYFMYSVFYKLLQSDMGKSIVRRHAPTLDPINTTNFNRNPQVKFLIPRTPKGKPKPKVASSKPRNNGPVYLPKHIFDMLSEEVKKELDNTIMKRRPILSPLTIGWPKSMNKIMEMRIFLRTLNQILTITRLKTDIPCKIQILKS